MFRSIVFIHRYVGIAVGLLMAVWCLSGVVMMYVPYPRLAEEKRVAGLPAIEWKACCVFESGARGAVIANDARVSSFQLEMLGARPVARVVLAEGGRQVIDLREGTMIDAVSDEDAASAGASLARSIGVSGEPRGRDLIMRDQWTVAYNRGERPIHVLEYDDVAGTVVYISSTSGKALQVTQSSQRFWNWLGAVPHWLYPTVLRQHTFAWQQVVIWASVIGTFLTVTGLYLGIKELRRRQNGRMSSPHRGLMYWHHVPGLVFGVLVLTWTVSGLFSMNPWGLMETQGVGADVESLSGEPPRWGEVRQFVTSLTSRSPEGIVSVASAPFGGQLFAVMTTTSGDRHRVDVQGAFKPLSKDELDAAARRLQSDETPAGWSLLESEDAYHYGTRSNPASLPVVRVNAGTSRYYLDPISGRLLNKADEGSKAFRWWHSALHTFDFSSVTRGAWFRNGLMLPLLLGTTFVCVTGTWLGIRRLTRA